MAAMTKFGVRWKTLMGSVGGTQNGSRKKPQIRPSSTRGGRARSKTVSNARSRGVSAPVILPAVASRLRRDLQSAGFTRAKIEVPRGNSLWIPGAPLLWFEVRAEDAGLNREQSNRLHLIQSWMEDAHE